MLRSLVVFAFLFLSVPDAGAAANCTAPARAVQPLAPSRHPEHGLLWRIDKAGAQPSYLLGTMHTADPRVLRIVDDVRPYLMASRSYTMELIMNGGAFIDSANAMYFNDGTTLESVVGKAVYARTVQALKARGLPIDDLQHKKPWTVLVALGMPQAKPGLPLDFALQWQATLAHKPVYGLETAKEQLDVFDAMSLKDQAAILSATLDQGDKSRGQMTRLTELYLRHDLAGLGRLGDADMPSGKPEEQLMRRLVMDRNRRMAERLSARLAEGGAFIAVGALHLPGPHGLIALLERRGYTLTPVY